MANNDWMSNKIKPIEANTKYNFLDDLVRDFVSEVVDEMVEKEWDIRTLSKKTGILERRLKNIINGTRNLQIKEMVLICESLGLTPNIDYYRKRGEETNVFAGEVYNR